MGRSFEITVDEVSGLTRESSDGGSGGGRRSLFDK
jgi:hypothetical protein